MSPEVSSQDAIRIENLVVHRGGKRVLHEVSLRLEPARITALVGANGAGKSTTVMTLAGALPASAGEILFQGASLIGLSPQLVRRRGIATVPEGHRVLGALTLRDNLRAAGSHLGRAELARSIEEALAIFPELGERLDVLAHALSGGQKQMLATAQALLAKPRFLVVDELSLGLAPFIVRRLAGILAEKARNGLGILIIEQFTALALELASDAYVLERGRIVYGGSASELRERPEILHSAYLAAEKPSSTR
ncbi:amino acid/amide ABC transporter ATP-binding protein 2, HAAT family [Rhizobiales bacterium GAS113]|nr:amino acid/amide ABC transporter ATP-binding protein 2, HAAT family [Rhizobiales bacterium GAS113]SEC55881.1 amino acid/amide ABC transporter ATP-binding protein 2, HAAT family [Rhizobiales bacterium GAS188]